MQSAIFQNNQSANCLLHPPLSPGKMHRTGPGIEPNALVRYRGKKIILLVQYYFIMFDKPMITSNNMPRPNEKKKDVWEPLHYIILQNTRRGCTLAVGQNFVARPVSSFASLLRPYHWQRCTARINTTRQCVVSVRKYYRY